MVLYSSVDGQSGNDESLVRVWCRIKDATSKVLEGNQVVCAEAERMEADSRCKYEEECREHSTVKTPGYMHA